jgi:hypothetical protein
MSQWRTHNKPTSFQKNTFYALKQAFLAIEWNLFPLLEKKKIKLPPPQGFGEL